MLSAQSFLHAILEDADADEPRLRYADWLDRTCDPLGDFIRVQCRLARQESADPFCFELETRQRELLGEFEPAWTAPIAGFVTGWGFHRGFVNEVIMPAANFVAHASTLFGFAPVREIHLADAAQHLEGLAASPFLQRVKFLDLSENRLGDSGVRLLAESKCFQGTRGMNLSGVGASDAGAEALARCPRVKDLTELYLSANKICDDGAHALAASPYLERLEVLFLTLNNVGPGAARALRQRFGGRVRI